MWIDNQQKWCWLDADKAAVEKMAWMGKRGLATKVSRPAKSLHRPPAYQATIVCPAV